MIINQLIAFKWQLCDREQAMKLKELGCLQIGTFYYGLGGDTPLLLLPGRAMPDVDQKSGTAYTTAELGVMLPDYTPTKRIVVEDFFTKMQRSIWSCQTEKNPVTRPKYDINIGGGPSEASIRASMLIYLLEGKHISVDDVNSRLEAAQL
jgi:hypothetical protein